MRIPLAIAVALLTAPAYAKPLECVLWPRSQVCRSLPAPEVIFVPVPAPAPPPVSAPPPAVTPQPPAAVPLPTPRPKAKPVRSNFIKPLKAAKRKAAAIDNNSGPDLPWSCWMVRLRASGMTCAQLKAEGASRGTKLSRKQERQALVCLGKLGKNSQCVD